MAWRTLSAADGHTMPGYFGFRIGAGAGESFVPTAGAAGASDALRTITRGLALIGLAALLGIAPVTLIVFGPITEMVPALGSALPLWLRRYAVAAAVVALLTSVAALVAEALAISPGLALPAAVTQTVTQTRYGQLWWWRLLLLALSSVTILAALWSRPDWRHRLLLAAALVGVVAPVPFSLLSHAAAVSDRQVTAVAIDAVHLLAAAVWGGGLFLLAAVLLSALRCVPGSSRRAVLRAVLARFSFIGLATWAILALSGLYAAWLHVGTVEALRETSYGQSLLLKGALLLPALVLAAWHLWGGWRGLTGRSAVR